MSEDGSTSDEFDPEFDPDVDDPQAEEEIDAVALVASSRAGDQVAADEEDDAQAGQTSGQAPAGRRPSRPRGAALADMLQGRAPMFIVHKSYQHSQHIPELLGVARRQVGTAAGLGVAVRLPMMSEEGAATYLGSCASAPLKIADPEIYTIPGTGSPAAQPSRATTYHSWMGAVPAQADPAWVRTVLDTQAAAGANVFLSASGWVDDTNGRQQLAAAMDWVRATRSELADEPMFVNLTLATGWLRDTRLRAALKQEIVESNEDLWWLRFYWPIVEPRYGQLVEPALLEGYRDLATTAALEDKIVVFPNSGLTGWMTTAWGAQGFSTGTSWTEQMFGAQPIRRSSPGKPKAAPVERYFDRTVLHTLPYAVHLPLRGQPNHLTCGCRFCRRLAQMNTYDQPTADLHYLLQCANLTATLNGRRPGLRALRQVRNARAFVKALPTPLAGSARPLQLPVWENLLR